MLHRPTIFSLNIAILTRHHNNRAGRQCTTMPIHTKHQLSRIREATVPRFNQIYSRHTPIPKTYPPRNQERSQVHCLARQSV
jgi:hypothetical protein